MSALATLVKPLPASASFGKALPATRVIREYRLTTPARLLGRTIPPFFWR